MAHDCYRSELGAGGGTLSDTSVTKEPTRIARDTDDLDAQFDAIVDALRREVRRLRQQVDRFGRTYQKQAEERSRRESDDADQTIQRSYRRLKQLQLVVQHIESSAAYLLGSGIDPSGEEEKDDMVEVAQRVLESLEAERERLYRDVHDGPAQVLANAIFEVEYLERIAERIPSEVRQTLRTELGLAEAMRNYSAEWEARCGIRVGSRLDTMNTHLAPLQELAVYRIMQEALQNVHKHAQASAVGMAWQRSTENWVLHVTDDGIGFDIVRTARHKKSVGLLSMRERAELIGGTLQIQSTPGKGTAVTLLLPTAKKIEPLRARREERVREEHS